MNALTESILNKTQIKAGLSLGEDDHVVALYHRDKQIRRYDGLILSRDEIIRDANDFIERRINGR